MVLTGPSSDNAMSLCWAYDGRFFSSVTLTNNVPCSSIPSCERRASVFSARADFAAPPGAVAPTRAYATAPHVSGGIPPPNRVWILVCLSCSFSTNSTYHSYPNHVRYSTLVRLSASAISTAITRCCPAAHTDFMNGRLSSGVMCALTLRKLMHLHLREMPADNWDRSRRAGPASYADANFRVHPKVQNPWMRRRASDLLPSCRRGIALASGATPFLLFCLFSYSMISQCKYAPVARICLPMGCIYTTQRHPYPSDS